MADADSWTLRDRATDAVSGLVGLVQGRDELLRHGGTMAVATVVAGGLNYGFQVVAGRALGPEQYGVFGALTSLFYLLNVGGRAVRLSAARFTAEFRTDDRRLSVFHRGLLLRTGVFSVGVFALLALTSTRLAAFLDVPSPWPVVVVAAAVPFSLVLPANFGLFQGRESFVRFGVYKVLQAGLTLSLAVGLLLLGYGIYGALGALFVGTAVAFVGSTVHARRSFRGAIGPTPADLTVDFARTYRYAAPALLAGFCLTVPTSVDVILAKHFFDAQAAGLYTAVAVLGKVLVFLPLGISMALFPKVSAAAADTDAGGLLARAFAYTAVLAGAGALGYWLVPDLVLGLVYTSEYAAAGRLLAWYGLAMLAYSLALVLLNFQLARDEAAYVYLFALVTLVEVGLLWRYHASMVGYAQILLVSNGLLVGAGLLEVRR